jgi:hypothetical protein
MSSKQIDLFIINIINKMIRNSYNKQVLYILKINKYNKFCKVCNSQIICDMCNRFGKVEGRKWMRQNKTYNLK